MKDKLHVLTPIQAIVTQCRSAVCGAEFTVWLCDGKLYAAGSPQYGVLGDGSSHEYNLSESARPQIQAICCGRHLGRP